MIIQPPLESSNGIISCPTCATQPHYYLEHKKNNISYLDIPVMYLPSSNIPSIEVDFKNNHFQPNNSDYSVYSLLFLIFLLIILFITIRNRK